VQRLAPLLLLLVIAAALAGLVVERRLVERREAAAIADGAGEFVAPGRIRVTDGDTIRIVSGRGPAQTVRILGIDAPEVRRSGVAGSMDQRYGPEARAFAAEVFGKATRVQIRRAKRPDRYGRTLAYLFIDGRNYSVMAIERHLAEETVSHYGPQGFPNEAKALREAAERAGRPPFESPANFRRRAVSKGKPQEARP